MWLEKRNGGWKVCWREGQKVRRVHASTDRKVAKAILGEMQGAQLRGERFTDQYKDHRNRPLPDHVADWISELRQVGRSEIYWSQCESRLARMIDECSWKLLADIDADDFMNWRGTALSDIAHARKDKTDLQPELLSARTQNHYFEALRTFCRWCVRRKRCATNPVADVPKVDEVGKERRVRRALAAEEVTRLLDAVVPEYRLLYRVLLTTGLRRGEAAQLQWGDLHLDATRPYILLRAATTKAKRADTLPLRADVSDELRAARGDAEGAYPVFRRVPRIREHLRWLKTAGIPYVDADGRRVDLHSLRHTYASWLSKTGATPREAMDLMRHTDLKLTLGTYTDLAIFNLAGAVEKLPLPPSQPDQQKQVATGTDGRVAKQGARQTADLRQKAAIGASGYIGEASKLLAKQDALRRLAAVGAGDEKMEAEGIEPSSRDNVDVGLYMLSRSFNLDASSEDRHSPPASRRLNLAFDQRPSAKASLLFSANRSQTSRLCRGHLLLGGHCERGSVETNATGNIIGISNYVFAQMISQANCASWACHRHRSHPVETDRPR